MHRPATACCFLKFGGLLLLRRRRLKTKRIRMTFVKRCSWACAWGNACILKGRGTASGTAEHTQDEAEPPRGLLTDWL